MDTWKRFGEREVSHSMAHYLQAVAALKKEKGFVRVGDLADRLGVSKSGATSMLRTLSGRGYVEHERYGCVELTGAGCRLAERTESSRHVLTVFLAEILGAPESVAEEDACMIEHLVSPEVVLRLLRLTTFLRSDHPAAAGFREAFELGEPACRHRAPESCGVCATTCLGETLSQEVSQGVADGVPTT